MLVCRSGFQTRIKHESPDTKTLHCMIHRQSPATRTMPQELICVLVDVVYMVNFIKSSALNTRLFKLLCQDLDAKYETVLFHTEVRWLSKGNRAQDFLVKIRELFHKI